MSLENSLYSKGDIVINIKYKDFGGKLKMGDLIATLNVLQYMRNVNNNSKIKFYIADSELQNEYHFVLLFRDFIIENSDYLSPISGDYDFEGFVEIWSFREGHGEFVSIENKLEIKRKICIFPLLDAPYDTERNFTNKILQDIIDNFSVDIYDEYEKIICLINSSLLDNLDINIRNFNVSTNFKENLYHLMECEYYIGGATGLSLFASVLNNVDNNKKLSYYYNNGYHGGWISSFTMPFYISKRPGEMLFFDRSTSSVSQEISKDVLEKMNKIKNA